MIRTLRAGAFIAATTALMFALTACTSPTPTGPSTATPAPTSAPTPAPVADPLTTVVGLVARPEGLELRADGGSVVATLEYMSPPIDAITALTAVFDAPPVDEPYAATNHRPGGVLHRWDLFVLDERLYDEARRQAEGYDWLVWPRFAVYFDGPAADGVVLSSSSGLQAGDAWSDAESDPGFDPDLWTCTGTSIEAVTTAVPSGWTGGDRVAVIVTPTDDGATVKWIGAPELEADGCA